MRKGRTVIVTIMCLLMIALLVPATVYGATSKPNKCPKCFKKYKIYYTITDYPVYSKTRIARYTEWVPVLDKPLYNAGNTTSRPSASKSSGTTVEYKASGSFTWGKFKLGSEYSKKVTKELGVSVPVTLKPKYYGQVYIATDVDKFKMTCKHTLKCSKCGYVYKKNYKTETKTIAAPLNGNAIKYKTKTSKKITDVNKKTVTYYTCVGTPCGGGGR